MFKSYQEIIPNLFLGNMHSTKNLKKEEIDHIFSIGPFSLSKEIPSTRIWVKDSMDEVIDTKLDKIIPIMHEKMQQNKKIYVHCRAGINRGPSFVLAYLCKYQKMEVNDALNLILSKRKICKFAQKEQVINWLKK